MAFDDPLVWVLIIVAIIFLFGGSKIPSLAKALGEARREFDKGWRGEPPGKTNPGVPAATPAQATSTSSTTTADDPLIAAAQREGIETVGKTREQIASELSWKLNKK